MFITCSRTSLPPGYNLSTIRAYVPIGKSDTKSNRLYGVAQFVHHVYISSSVMSIGPASNVERIAVIGHELVHAKNFQDHGTKFGNPVGQNDFINTSEHEAYQWQADYFRSNGFSTLADEAHARADCYQPLAVANWDSSFSPSYTEIPSPPTLDGPPTTSKDIVPTTTEFN